MEYYRIIQESYSKNTIKPKFPSVSQIWMEEKPMFLPGSAEVTDKEMQFLSFYQATILSGAFLVSKPVGDIWKEFQSGGRYRPCALGHIDTRNIKPYYFMYPRLLDAIHPDTQFFPNGEFKNICLSLNHIKFHKIFGVRDTQGTCIIGSGDVLDKMLREGEIRFTIEPLTVRGE